MFAFATAIAEFISFFVARAGITARTRRAASYRELGLQLRDKTPKRRVKAKLPDDRRPATRSNETWAMVHDQLATGRKLRVLTVIDIFSRFSPTDHPLAAAKSPAYPLTDACPFGILALALGERPGHDKFRQHRLSFDTALMRCFECGAGS